MRREGSRERVLAALRLSSLPLDDDQLSERADVHPRQQVNQICRSLENGGLIHRFRGPAGKIVNELSNAEAGPGLRPEPAGPADTYAGSASVALALAADQSADQGRPPVSSPEPSQARTAAASAAAGSGVTTGTAFQRLGDRLAGHPAEDVRFTELLPHLDHSLRRWVEEVLDQYAGLARAVALRLRLVPQVDYRTDLRTVRREGVLDVVDAVLQLHPARAAYDSGDYRHVADGHFLVQRWQTELEDLRQILEHGGSAYRIDEHGRHLERRVDSTVAAAAQAAQRISDRQASAHLAKAWAKAYGRLDADPDDAYDHAIKAVEAVACPLVLPTENLPTLGKVISSLDKGRDKWSLTLVNRDDQGDIEPLVVMMRRLWQGHRSRHSGGPTSRMQTQLEAEAAVHLAVLLVQWLSSGVLAART
jgi:hypothetical protein